LSATDPDAAFDRPRFSLTQAGEQILDALLNLQQFCDQTQMWTEFADVAAPTVAALAQHRSAIEAVRTAVKRQFATLAAECVLLDAAWKTHADGMRQTPRPQPVSDDARISAALAARFANATDDAAREAVHATLDEFGLQPEGPDWARWALEIRHGRLSWVPFLPTEPETPPTGPPPREPGGRDSGEAPDEPVESDPPQAEPAAAANRPTDGPASREPISARAKTESAKIGNAIADTGLEIRLPTEASA
jgi:hypothetical protein